jgi:quercetin dioxygenase-like cupin family protein
MQTDRLRRLCTLLLTGSVVVALAAAYAAGANGRPSAQAVRESLAQVVNPAGAKGRTLGLARVTIPAHTALAQHRHPGTQIAYIQSGTLTYTVKTGSVPLYRGAADDKPRLIRTVKAGHSGTVLAGDWVIERPGTIHFGANNGSRPLVILLATLFRDGRPPSIPVAD